MGSEARREGLLVNREDVIRMAQECQLIGMRPHLDGIYEEALQRFAALVAAAEREKVAAWMRSKSYATGHGDTTEDLLKELEWQVAEREREALGDIILDYAERDDLSDSDESLLKHLFELIRARGET